MDTSVITRKLNMIGLKIKQHSPEILLAGGIVGVVTSTVMACKATTKASLILEETKVKLDQVHAIMADEDVPEQMYSAEDAKKDTAIIYAQSGLQLAKTYAPAIAVGALSIVSILASHNIMHKRNVGLTAAYVALNQDYKGYRSRVVERFGEALDRELKYNLKAKEIEETAVNENGEEIIVKKTVNVASQAEQLYSEYAVCFTTGCKGWTKNAELNKAFLIKQEQWANDLLRTRGYVFLNEIYEALGIPLTQTGHVVGWIYDDKNPNGDNFISFGIFDIYKEVNRDFVNGYEQSIWLDFNVDGPIWDRVKKY